MKNIIKLGVLSLLCFSSMTLAAEQSEQDVLDSIPVAPVSVMKRPDSVEEPVVKKAGVAKVAKTPSPDLPVKSPVKSFASETRLVMKPGINQIIPIAIGHPNRIVTPFGKPSITSTTLEPGDKDGCGELCIKQNVVYVATSKEHPVTMFITEKGSEARALSLTMVPQRIPPREIFLSLDEQSILPGMFSNNKAKKWEQSQPYIKTITRIFRKMALGEIPNGYSMNRVTSHISVPSCAMEGIDVSFAGGQMMMGHHLTVFVGIATNQSDTPVEFQEQSCGNWDVAAVTSWPHKMLAPGQSTEVYVAVKRHQAKGSATKRPSLIGGAR